VKIWPLTVALLYGILLILLGYPLVKLAFIPKGPDLTEYAQAFSNWQPWALVGLMVVSQFALLRIPVARASGRPVAQRSIWSTVISSAFMMGLLIFGAIVSIQECIGKVATDTYGLWPAVICAVASWIFWTCYFHRAASSTSPADPMRAIRKHLWTGSILELLVAIPTHIFVRHRGECCAGFGTFLGLSCGFAVMIFAFGPSLYFLFLVRRRRYPSVESGSLHSRK
jgi:hypothetical protein